MQLQIQAPKNWSQTLNKPLKQLTFLAFDSEATGRHPIVSELVELAGLKFNHNGEILDIKQSLINPGRPIPALVSEVHGISDEMVASAPKAEFVIPDFINWVQSPAPGISNLEASPVLLAHNASFDVNFLQVALSRMQAPMPISPVVDTLQLARRFFPQAKNHRLNTLMDMLKPGQEKHFHRAEVDSRHVMTLFLSILEKLAPDARLKDLIEDDQLFFFSNPFEPLDSKQSAKDLKVRKISEAICRSFDLFIHYNGTGGKFRQITPLSVIYSAKRYYLSAFCHRAGNERIFRVNRISSLEFVPRSEVKI